MKNKVLSVLALSTLFAVGFNSSALGMFQGAQSTGSQQEQNSPLNQQPQSYISPVSSQNLYTQNDFREQHQSAYRNERVQFSDADPIVRQQYIQIGELEEMIGELKRSERYNLSKIDHLNKQIFELSALFQDRDLRINQLNKNLLDTKVKARLFEERMFSEQDKFKQKLDIFEEEKSALLQKLDEQKRSIDALQEQKEALIRDFLAQLQQKDLQIEELTREKKEVELYSQFVEETNVSYATFLQEAANNLPNSSLQETMGFAKQIHKVLEDVKLREEARRKQKERLEEEERAKEARLNEINLRNSERLPQDHNTFNSQANQKIEREGSMPNQRNDMTFSKRYQPNYNTFNPMMESKRSNDMAFSQGYPQNYNTFNPMTESEVSKNSYSKTRRIGFEESANKGQSKLKSISERSQEIQTLDPKKLSPHKEQEQPKQQLSIQERSALITTLDGKKK